MSDKPCQHGHYPSEECVYCHELFGKPEPPPAQAPKQFDLRRVYISLFTNTVGQQFYSQRSVDELIAAYERLERQLAEANIERESIGKSFASLEQELTQARAELAAAQSRNGQLANTIRLRNDAIDDARAELAEQLGLNQRLNQLLFMDGDRIRDLLTAERAKSAALLSYLKKIEEIPTCPDALTERAMEVLRNSARKMRVRHGETT